MKARIVRIGNSRGVRIPKPMLEQVGLHDDVEIVSHEGSLIVHPASRPRAGWGEAFKAMAQRGDDALLDEAPLSTTSWDEEEWQW